VVLLCSSGAQRGTAGLLQLQESPMAPLHVAGILQFKRNCNHTMSKTEGHQMQFCEFAGALLLLLMVLF
jgi:hypothetical protein